MNARNEHSGRVERRQETRPQDPAVDEAGRRLRARLAQEARVRSETGPLPLPYDLVDDALRFTYLLRNRGLPVERVVAAVRRAMHDSGFERTSVPHGRSQESRALVLACIRAYFGASGPG